MPQPGLNAACDETRRRPGRPDEIALDSLMPDPFARLTLSLLRWHFQTFAAPASQGWLRALHCATLHAGPNAAGALCYDLVAVVQALRATRRSSFRFNPEGCACCRVWLTPDERRLVEMIGAVRAGRLGRAQALGQILCDGNPAENLIAMTEVYLNRHAPRASPGADDERPDPMVCRPQPG
ncbi:MAG: hypothetical protein ACK4OP_03525 [Gemmobacter sp.]